MTPWKHTVTTRNFLSLSVIAALLIILSPVTRSLNRSRSRLNWSEPGNPSRW